MLWGEGFALVGLATPQPSAKAGSQGSSLSRLVGKRCLQLGALGEEGSTLYTDSLRSYHDLNDDTHEFIDHAIEYVRGNVHTKGMESYWSLLKRAPHGTYISLEPFHLFRYLDEQAFRFNNRVKTDAQRFALAIAGIFGRMPN